MLGTQVDDIPDYHGNFSVGGVSPGFLRCVLACRGSVTNQTITVNPGGVKCK